MFFFFHEMFPFTSHQLCAQKLKRFIWLIIQYFVEKDIVQCWYITVHGLALHTTTPGFLTII